MADLQIHRDNEITIFTVHGKLSSQEIIALLHKYYSPVTKQVLWDLRDASISEITHKEFQKIAKTSKSISGDSIRRKTVFIGSTPVCIGLTNMYTTIAQMSQLPSEYLVTQHEEEAIQWLLGQSSENYEYPALVEEILNPEGG